MRRLSLFAVLAALALAALVPAVSAGAASHSKPCSTKGLRYSYKSGGTTFSVKVTRLRTSGVACGTARTVAKTVAKKMLHLKQVPHKVHGLTVSVESPCSGCAPDSQVTAKHGKRRVTFHVLGGA